MRLLLLVLLAGPLAGALSAEPPLLTTGDRIALLGGTFIERMQSTGSLEAEIQCRRPDWQLSVRNLGWSGDDVHGIARKRFDGPQGGFNRILADVESADPTLVLVAYGFSEASDGKPAVSRFQAGLETLLGELRRRNRRIVLMTPLAMPGYRVADYDSWISQCRGIVEQVGESERVPVVSIDWQPTAAELTQDQLLPSQAGYERLASQIADRLVGGRACQNKSAKMRERIVEKNQLFFHHYRPQNETYLLLFRKHEQGNNAVELEQFRPLIEQADREIWELAGR
jgi:lysophospholipase L1-like esterase